MMLEEQSKFIYHVWQSTVIRAGAPVLVKSDTLKSFGFSSIYGITKESRDIVVASGTTAGFKGKIWSERLWVDIDDNEQARIDLEELLEKNGVDYVTYFSGGRGYHVGILRTHPPCSKLHLKDKYWVKQNCPKADQSLYSPLHLLRRPGDRHEKTAQSKREIKRHEGQALDLTDMVVPDSFLNPVDNSRDTPDPNKSIFDDLYIRGLTKPVDYGNRHYNFVRLASALHGRGYDKEFIRTWVYEQNKLNFEPKDTSEIDKVVEDICG